MQEKSKPVDNLRADAEKIITRAIAAGKAAWQMARAARACLQDNFCLLYTSRCV